jgi:hypothetical protein
MLLPEILAFADQVAFHYAALHGNRLPIDHRGRAKRIEVIQMHQAGLSKSRTQEISSSWIIIPLRCNYVTSHQYLLLSFILYFIRDY